jgi:hypothetical protein
MYIAVPSLFPSIQPTDTPSTSPSEFPTINQKSTRVLQIIDFLSPIVGAEKFTLLEWTPQNEAAKWLANDDESSGGWQSMEDVSFLQRYVLATMYFAFQGQDWSFSVQFLTPESECTWFQDFLVTDLGKRTVGVTCNEAGRVTAISLRK